jgi:hypothetical protein
LNIISFWLYIASPQKKGGLEFGILLTTGLMHHARKETSSCGVSVVFSGEICPIFQQRNCGKKMENFKSFSYLLILLLLFFFFFVKFPKKTGIKIWKKEEKKRKKPTECGVSE